MTAVGEEDDSGNGERGHGEEGEVGGEGVEKPDVIVVAVDGFNEEGERNGGAEVPAIDEEICGKEGGEYREEDGQGRDTAGAGQQRKGTDGGESDGDDGLRAGEHGEKGEKGKSEAMGDVGVVDEAEGSVKKKGDEKEPEHSLHAV